MLLLSLALFTTSFGPGSVDDFAHSLAESTGTNAVVVTSKAMQLPQFSYDSSNADAFATSVLKGAKLVMAPGGSPYFSDKAYVGSHFEVLGPFPGGPKTTGKLSDDAIKDGMVTLDTKEGGAILLSNIVEAKWSRPVQVDYLMRDLAVSVSVKGMKEGDFLGAVAKAAGGFLSANSSGYKLSYDAEQLRARVINTLNEIPARNPKQQVDVKREFYAAVVNILPQELVLKTFQQPDVMNRIDIVPNSDMATVCVNYIKAVEALSQGEPTGDQPGARYRPGRANRTLASRDILSRVDNRAVVHLSLNGHGMISLAVPLRRGRTSQYIDM